jgi:hypothetical protein
MPRGVIFRVPSTNPGRDGIAAIPDFKRAELGRLARPIIALCEAGDVERAAAATRDESYPPKCRAPDISGCHRWRAMVRTMTETGTWPSLAMP